MDWTSFGIGFVAGGTTAAIAFFTLVGMLERCLKNADQIVARHAGNRSAG